MEDLKNEFFNSIKQKSPFKTIEVEYLKVTGVNQEYKARLEQLPTYQTSSLLVDRPSLLLNGLGENERGSELLKELNKTSQVLFAPTGAGKTRLLFEAMCSLPDEVCFFIKMTIFSS